MRRWLISSSWSVLAAQRTIRDDLVPVNWCLLFSSWWLVSWCWQSSVYKWQVTAASPGVLLRRNYMYIDPIVTEGRGKYKYITSRNQVTGSWCKLWYFFLVYSNHCVKGFCLAMWRKLRAILCYTARNSIVWLAHSNQLKYYKSYVRQAIIGIPYIYVAKIS